MTQWSNKSTSPYTRFIPREEIDAVAAWRFSNVDGTPHADEIKAAEVTLTPEMLEASVAAARELAREEGFASGHQAGCDETRAALEEPARLASQHMAKEAQEAYDSILALMREQIAQAQDHMANTVLHMACELARQVVRRELSIDPNALKPALDEALTVLIDDSLPVTVRLNPADLERMDTWENTTARTQPPKFVADPNVTPGGCLLEAPGQTVDATLEKRWARAIANLGLESAWESDHGAA